MSREHDYRSILVRRIYDITFEIVKSEVLMVEGVEGVTRSDIEQAAAVLNEASKPFVDYDDPVVHIDCIGDFDDRYKTQKSIRK